MSWLSCLLSTVKAEVWQLILFIKQVEVNEINKNESVADAAVPLGRDGGIC